MPRIGDSLLIESRAVGLGVTTFMVVVVLLPLAANLIASFGPTAWIYALDPIMGYRFILYVLAGAISGSWSNRNPLAISIWVGFLGGSLLFLLSLVMNASLHLTIMELLVRHIPHSIFWCAVGGVAVIIYRKVKSAL